jgi:hypothetical protein
VLKQIRACTKGDYIKVRWFDASDETGTLLEHCKPEVLVNEWGIFLSVEGSPKHLVLGKSFVEKDRVWMATRIPCTLIKSIDIIVKEAASSTQLRRYIVRNYQPNFVRVKG